LHDITEFSFYKKQFASHEGNAQLAEILSKIEREMIPSTIDETEIKDLENKLRTL
jgi:hypothetical protein